MKIKKYILFNYDDDGIRFIYLNKYLIDLYVELYNRTFYRISHRNVKGYIIHQDIEDLLHNSYYIKICILHTIKYENKIEK